MSPKSHCRSTFSCRSVFRTRCSHILSLKDQITRHSSTSHSKMYNYGREPLDKIHAACSLFGAIHRNGKSKHVMIFSGPLVVLVCYASERLCNEEEARSSMTVACMVSFSAATATAECMALRPRRSSAASIASTCSPNAVVEPTTHDQVYQRRSSTSR